MKKYLKSYKKILNRLSLTFISILLVSCEDTNNYNYNIEFDLRLNQDENGYYHLTLDRYNWQTLHRVTASVKGENQKGLENFWIEWDANLYWYIGDTLGYVVSRGLNSELQYVNYDTNYVTWFTGFEVPTTNQVSYSGEDGMLNNMIAPVRSMIGDTLMLTAFWFDGSATFGIVLD